MIVSACRANWLESRNVGFDYTYYPTPFVFLLSLPAPSQASEVISAYSTISTKLLVTWSHLSNDSFHGKSPTYKITYHLIDLQLEMNFVIVNFTN